MSEGNQGVGGARVRAGRRWAGEESVEDDDADDELAEEATAEEEDGALGPGSAAAEAEDEFADDDEDARSSIAVLLLAAGARRGLEGSTPSFVASNKPAVGDGAQRRRTITQTRRPRNTSPLLCFRLLEDADANRVQAGTRYLYPFDDHADQNGRTGCLLPFNPTVEMERATDETAAAHERADAVDAGCSA